MKELLIYAAVIAIGCVLMIAGCNQFMSAGIR